MLRRPLDGDASAGGTLNRLSPIRFKESSWAEVLISARPSLRFESGNAPNGVGKVLTPAPPHTWIEREILPIVCGFARFILAAVQNSVLHQIKNGGDFMARHSGFKIGITHEACGAFFPAIRGEEMPERLAPQLSVRSGELPLPAYHHPVCKQPGQTQQGGARHWEAVHSILHAENDEKELRDGLPATEVRLQVLARAALVLAHALELSEVLHRLETKLGWLASVEAFIHSASGCAPLRAISPLGVALSQSPLNAVAGPQEGGSTMREKVASEYSASRPSGIND